ncbi:MAG: hypothetical protein D6711_09410 [Chloroflexi bacterium]|nr:MAG: hypothetical protein D6711_09410 [Chloroflexota bacterium]
MNIDWIEPGVLAASHYPHNAQDVDAIFAANIKAVVSLTEMPVAILKPFIHTGEIQYLHAPINDYQAPTLSTVYSIIQFIEQMKDCANPVLIHCMAGIGRTGTVLHAYYIYRGMTLSEAKRLIANKRPANQFRYLSLSQRQFLAQFAGDQS